ncbi:WD repeat-containing protein on Y chromosome-like [Limanda limanda]|uniref:WD repeat-containing protein on Y chromosome-like n=1 Tax=Limanda limanda TaxID=27771 RepID=UPI0029C70E12|nr:WD repeat-containing protein on Y chromosome-like [Limanda limanda]
MMNASDMTKIAKAMETVCCYGLKQRLDFKEFCALLKPMNISLSDAEIYILYKQIGTNPDKTMDSDQVLNFLVNRKLAHQRLYFGELFPKPFEIVPVDHYREIVRLLFHPFEDENNPEPDKQVSTESYRAFRRGQYLSISSDAVLNMWTDRFALTQTIPLHKIKKTTLPFSNHRKMKVQDMVYIKELKQLAISTEREVLFYNCDCNTEIETEVLEISHSLMVDKVVTAMSYWSNESKSVFSFGDTDGFLYMFISYAIRTNGLFCQDFFKIPSMHEYPSVHVSDLLDDPSNHVCVKVHNFNDACTQIQYFPLLDTFVTLSGSSCTMVLTSLNTSHGITVSQSFFESRGDHKYFLCVEHASSCGYLVTGGSDGLLRLWLPHRKLSCVRSLTEHVKPIIYIRFNPKDRIVLSISKDMNVCVWTESWQCIQSFHVHGMEQASMASVCYNIHNNELILTNSDIRKCLGRGTDVYKITLTSHDMPLCSALYHSSYKQVISVCQSGVVTVWDFLTGKAVMQFDVTPNKHKAITAMSFDETQEGLVTISWDGKVRLWNFNSGSELAVHAVNLPNQVTGIVCTKNRMFVSIKYSKIIFDLDLVGDDNKLLEHQYLSDISSMDNHENTLVAASNNRNVVIWDACSGETLYWLNTSTSPRTHVAFRKSQGQIRRLITKKQQQCLTAPGISLTGAKSEVEVNHLVTCLRARENTCTTATLLTSADGCIYAWSAKSKGGLLGKFNAVNGEDAALVIMSPDVKGRRLLTGDTTGRICLWDIQEFGFNKQTDEGPFEDMDGWRVSLCTPPLLACWQSHHKGIVSAVSDPTGEHIITAGLDHNVKLWTNTGCCRGLFGRNQWDASQPCNNQDDQ